MALGHQIGANEISAAALFSKFERQSDPVVDGKIDQLPLHDRLTPENFERLIARLADPKGGISVQAFRYGSSGSTQGGVDVMVLNSTTQKCDYYEGKRWARIAKGDITSWVDKFLDGPHAADAGKFVLCTTYNVFKVTDLALEWKECAKLLAARQINGDLWDGDKIHTLLRFRHDVVSELFGDDVADRYCVQEIRPPAQPPDRSFESQRVRQFERILSLQNVSVACEITIPDGDAMCTGAILSFARHNLSGVSISLAGKEIVQWMQWRAHAPDNADRPYALPMAEDSNRLVLMAKSSRLVLTIDEVGNLDWVLKAAWSVFFKNVNERLRRYRCGRFKRLLGGSGPFVIASVDRALWRAMLEFAQEHDVAKGNSSWYMFDGAPGCLKPYSQRDTERFDCGYHAILYAYEASGIWLPWEDSVAIGWEVPTGIDCAVELSARKTWDAEYTHDWLLEEFIPEVLRWTGAMRLATRSNSSFWSRRTVGPTVQRPALKVSDVALPSAIGPNLRTVPEDLEGLQSCIQTLQSHFNRRRSGVSIESALCKAVLTAIDRVLTFGTLPYEGYLRSALNISADEDLVHGVRARARVESTVNSQTAMDFCLRGLLEVMGAIAEVPAGEWRSISAMLQPVLDRYHEDIVCDLFTTEY